MAECMRQLDAMAAPSCPSRFFSVGVRSCFPTSLVTDYLYPKFGRESDVSAPPVLPLESAEEAPWVFEQLQSHVNDLGPVQPPRLEDFNEDTPTEALYVGAKRVSEGLSGIVLHRRDPGQGAGLNIRLARRRTTRACTAACSASRRRSWRRSPSATTSCSGSCA